MNQPYSSHANANQEIRIQKADKIISVLKEFKDLSNCNILDIGTGSGHIIAHIAQYAQQATSVNLSDERVIKEGYTFKEVKDDNLPFENETFDVVISNQVIEHTPNQPLHLEEIARVLKNDGVVYLATPNRFALVEPHFGLPFLSWLPHRLASWYLRICKNKEWDVYSRSYPHLLRLIAKEFVATDMTISILKNPDHYRLDVAKSSQKFISKLPKFLLQILKYIFPSYIFILRKINSSV